MFAVMVGARASVRAQAPAYDFTAMQVDKPVVRLANGVAPQFPDSLLPLGLSGFARVTFVVDTNGRADMATFRQTEYTSRFFVESVREALPRMRFLPATIGGKKVRQIVDQRFEFDSPVPKPCKSPCPFMLLPLISPPPGHVEGPIPNLNPLAELQGRRSVVVKITEGDFPVAPPALFEYQVDKPASPARKNVSPVYPDSLRKANVYGEVIASFVVDTLGQVEVESIQILKSTHQLFAMSVLEALPRMKFLPAELHGVKVRQVVQQPFIFHTKQ